MNKVHKYIRRYRYRNGAACIIDIGPFINAGRFILGDGFLAIGSISSFSCTARLHPFRYDRKMIESAVLSRFKWSG